MRTLSQSERRIVKQMCAGTQFFSDLFEKDFLTDLVIEITQDVMLNNFQVNMYFDKRDQRTDQLTNRKLMDATEQIVQTINLLTYLRKEAYVYSYKPSHGTSVHGYIGLKTTYRNTRTIHLNLLKPNIQIRNHKS